MAPRENKNDKLTRITRELGTALRRQAAGTWSTVKTSERGEERRHAWRFRPDQDSGVRFLRVTHDALNDEDAGQLLEHLTAARWLDRLHDGPETSLVLDKGGRVERWIER
ncbi:MAG TPA: hypothetical protein VFE05_23610 [Longimicrobiaceae bacterium]|jgi:hypothetical protein|nr:hypothetical protein [Longimicrobiaceae bacterium]